MIRSSLLKILLTAFIGLGITGCNTVQHNRSNNDERTATSSTTDPFKGMPLYEVIRRYGPSDSQVDLGRVQFLTYVNNVAFGNEYGAYMFQLLDGKVSSHGDEAAEYFRDFVNQIKAKMPWAVKWTERVGVWAIDDALMNYGKPFSQIKGDKIIVYTYKPVPTNCMCELILTFDKGTRMLTNWSGESCENHNWSLYGK